MSKSKYSSKPEVNDAMVNTTIAWIDQSLVEYIPIMVAYPAFSAKLLQVALARPGNAEARWTRDENVMRTMEFLANPQVADTPGVLFDPDFIHDLLNYAINGNQAIRAVSSEAPTPPEDAAEVAPPV
jgi:hypothetical protein